MPKNEYVEDMIDERTVDEEMEEPLEEGYLDEEQEPLDEGEVAEEYAEEEDTEEQEEDVEEEGEEEEEDIDEEEIQKLKGVSMPQKLFEELYDKKLAIKYTNVDGREVTDEVPVGELPKIFEIARKGVDALEFQQMVTPVVESFKKSKAMQDLYYYVSQGYSDEDIKRGLAKLWAQESSEQPQEEPEFASEEERINYLVEQRLKQYLDPIQKELMESKNQQQVQSIVRHNQEVLTNALSNIGIEPDELTEAQKLAIDNSFATLYPGVNPYHFKLTPAQANVIIKDALSRGGVKNAKKKMTSSQMIKAAKKNTKATKMIAGKSVRPTSNKGSEYDFPIPIVSEAERRKRVNELFNG